MYFVSVRVVVFTRYVVQDSYGILAAVGGRETGGLRLVQGGACGTGSFGFQSNCGEVFN